jgi:hypothetical protein
MFEWLFQVRIVFQIHIQWVFKTSHSKTLTVSFNDSLNVDLNTILTFYLTLKCHSNIIWNSHLNQNRRFILIGSSNQRLNDGCGRMYAIHTSKSLNGLLNDIKNNTLNVTFNWAFKRMTHLMKPVISFKHYLEEREKSFKTHSISLKNFLFFSMRLTDIRRLFECLSTPFCYTQYVRVAIIV